MQAALKRAYRRLQGTFGRSKGEREEVWQRIKAMEQGVAGRERRRGTLDERPMLFFNASSHCTNFTFNSFVGMLTAWSMRLAGHPVRYLVCCGGLTKCRHGVDVNDPHRPPPCDRCVHHNLSLYASDMTIRLDPNEDLFAKEHNRVESLSLEELVDQQHDDIPIGQLCIPATRWVLRRHDLAAIPAGQIVLANFVVAARCFAQSLDEIFHRERPRAIVAFNGTFFPEATLRAVAERHQVPTVTYETGYRRLSAFFSRDVSTKYSIEVPSSFEMGPSEDRELDNYLRQRFAGKFTMGHVRFFPEMKTVDPELRNRASKYRRVVTVFTNVAFDTSQTHANTIFDNMFDWLDSTFDLAAASSEDLFIIRAHPDESRPGKQSQETIEQWLKGRGGDNHDNIVFFGPDDYVSSYELAQLSDFCIVYNSTIGVEATILGTPVVSGGLDKAWRENISHSPKSRAEYVQLVESFLRNGPPPVSEELQQRARRFLYYTHHYASFDFSPFIDHGERDAYRLRGFKVDALHPDRSAPIREIHEMAQQPLA